MTAAFPLNIRHSVVEMVDDNTSARWGIFVQLCRGKGRFFLFFYFFFARSSFLALILFCAQ